MNVRVPDKTDDIVLKILAGKPRSSVHMEAVESIKARRSDLMEMRRKLISVEAEIQSEQTSHVQGTLEDICEISTRSDCPREYMDMMNSLLAEGRQCQLAFDANRHLARLRNVSQRSAVFALLALDCSKRNRYDKCIPSINTARRLITNALPHHMAAHQDLMDRNPRLASDLV